MGKTNPRKGTYYKPQIRVFLHANSAWGNRRIQGCGDIYASLELVQARALHGRLAKFTVFKWIVQNRFWVRGEQH